MAKVVIENSTGNNDKCCVDMNIGEVGIVTQSRTANVVGEFVVKGYGQIVFVNRATWSRDPQDYRARPLTKDERIIITAD